MTNEQLAALDAAASPGVWRTESLGQSTQIWARTFVGETRDYDGDDAAFIVALVNACRAGQLVVRTEPSEADVVRVAMSEDQIYEIGKLVADKSCFKDKSDNHTRVWLAAQAGARAAIAAMVR